MPIEKVSVPNPTVAHLFVSIATRVVLNFHSLVFLLTIEHETVFWHGSASVSNGIPLGIHLRPTVNHLLLPGMLVFFWWNKQRTPGIPAWV